MRLCRDKPDVKDRAAAMHQFMTRCAARGIKVTLRLRERWNPELGRHESDLFLCASSTVDGRDPINLEERIDGDIRDTIMLVAMQIGLRGTPA